MSIRLVLALAALLAVPLSGCAVGSSSGKPQVVASFYPLQYVAERIVGQHAEVTDLTAPGVEPHDLELSPRQTAQLATADVALYEKGLQPAVDEAIANDPPGHVVDAAAVVGLHQTDGALGRDPHFWLDPTLLAKVAAQLTTAVAAADPAHAADYRSADAALQADLTTLDQEYRRGLAQCRSRTLVVSHDAFGYLAERYHLEVHSIAGLSPDAEPSPRHLAEIGDLVRSEHVTTVFSERLASSRMAESLARDLGVTTAVLDPLEGLVPSESGEDYLSLMRENLAAIRKADRCQ